MHFFVNTKLYAYFQQLYENKMLFPICVFSFNVVKGVYYVLN